MSWRIRFLVLLVLGLVAILVIGVLDAATRAAFIEPLDTFSFAFWIRAWQPTFFQLLPTATVGILVLSFSLVVSPIDLRPATRLVPAISMVMITIVALGVVNGLWVALLEPRVEARLERVAFESELARVSWDEAQQSRAAGRLTDALDQALVHISIAGSSEEALRFIQEVRAEAATEDRLVRRTARPPELEAGPRAVDARELSVADLVMRAQDFFAVGDFISAHYFASLAIELSGDTRIDARRLQSRALAAIEGAALGIEEAAARDYYRDKIQAYEYLIAGSDSAGHIIETYLRFMDLAMRQPEDTDLATYLPLAREALRRIAFPVAEAQASAGLPGTNNLVFINRETPGFVELVVVDRVVESRDGVFFHGIEVLQRREPGAEMPAGPLGGLGLPSEPVVHLRAPYGKLIESMLVMRAVRPDGEFSDPDSWVVAPTYYIGAPPDDVGFAIPLQYGVDELRAFAAGPESTRFLPITDLMTVPALLEEIGRPSVIAWRELARRLLAIGGFFVLAFAALAFAWGYRSRYYATPPLPVILLIPAVPLVVWQVLEAIRRLGVLLARRLAELIPGSWLVIGAGALVVLGIVLALLSLSRQTVET